MEATSTISGPTENALLCGARDQFSTPPILSIAIFAWNEEKIIGATLKSLFEQTLFSELSNRGWQCEINCVVNGCSDSTPQIARKIFSDQARDHAQRNAFKGRVVEISTPGKLNAWNQFVHSISAPSAAYLIMMDADISFCRAGTLWSLLQALQQDDAASVSVDRPRKTLEFKANRSLADWLSMRMANLTSAAPGQLCGQLYCIRSEIARNIYLPKDLGACEDGFIKALVCSDFLSRPVTPSRITLAPDAEHAFEAYTSPLAIFRNQKRQMIGQTVVHVLIDQYLPSLSPLTRLSLSEFLRKKDESEPDWLKLLIRDHLRRTKVWWRLYPRLLTQRFKNLRRLPLAKRILCFPAALASTILALFTSFAAWNKLRSGGTSYWPKAPRRQSTAQPADAAFSTAKRFQGSPIAGGFAIGADGVTPPASTQH